MKPQDYQKFREMLGSRNLLAELLKVEPSLIEKRENGEVEISVEAELSLILLVDTVLKEYCFFDPHARRIIKEYSRRYDEALIRDGVSAEEIQKKNDVQWKIHNKTS